MYSDDPWAAALAGAEAQNVTEEESEENLSLSPEKKANVGNDAGSSVDAASAYLASLNANAGGADKKKKKDKKKGKKDECTLNITCSQI